MNPTALTVTPTAHCDPHCPHCVTPTALTVTPSAHDDTTLGMGQSSTEGDTLLSAPIDLSAWMMKIGAQRLSSFPPSHSLLPPLKLYFRTPPHSSSIPLSNSIFPSVSPQPPLPMSLSFTLSLVLPLPRFRQVAPQQHGWIFRKVPLGAHWLWVAGLWPETCYQFSVLAQSERGSSPFTEILSACTQSECPP